MAVDILEPGINVKNLNVAEKSRSKLYFNPEVDLTSEDRDVIVSQIKHNLDTERAKRGNHEWGTNLREAVLIKAIDERLLDRIGLNNADLESMKEDYLEAMELDYHTHSTLRQIAMIKCVFPKADLSELPLDPPDVVIDNIKGVVGGSDIVSDISFEYLNDQQFALRVVYPELPFTRYELSDSQWEKCLKALDSHREYGKSGGDRWNRWSEFFAYAARLKLAAPDRFSKDIEISESEWDEGKKLLHGNIYPNTAFRLLVLQAEEIAITSEGYKFTLPPATVDNTPAIPEERNF